MGHLAIVDGTTILSINDTNPYISITGTLGSLGLKTLSDLFADALTVRAGDKIFTWSINGGVGFDRYYIANGDVVFDPNDPYPIKIGLQSGVKYTKPLSEEEALDIFSPRLLWNAIGKKSLGRGRGLSHQTIDEDDQLIKLLESKNIGVPATPILTHPISIAGTTPISISKFGTNQNPPIQNPIESVPLSNIEWNSGSLFVYEKTLEAYICANIDKPICRILKLLGYGEYSVKWFGNYLPYQVAGKNIDLVVEIENQNDHRVLVIELKKDKLVYDNYYHIASKQLRSYVKFITKAYSAFGYNDLIVEPIIIGGAYAPEEEMAGFQMCRETKWIGYDIHNNNGNWAVNFYRYL